MWPCISLEVLAVFTAKKNSTTIYSITNLMISYHGIIVELLIFWCAGPYPPALNVNISYEPPKKPKVVATISEIPRWPGYETVQFWMNITDMKDNQLLGRYNASAENSTIEIEAALPDSVVNQCATLKVSASAVSEQYGEGEATETFAELYKSKLIAIKTVKDHNNLIFPLL